MSPPGRPRNPRYRRRTEAGSSLRCSVEPIDAAGVEKVGPESMHALPTVDQVERRGVSVAATSHVKISHRAQQRCGGRCCPTNFTRKGLRFRSFVTMEVSSNPLKTKENPGLGSSSHRSFPALQTRTETCIRDPRSAAPSGPQTAAHEPMEPIPGSLHGAAHRP